MGAAEKGGEDQTERKRAQVEEWIPRVGEEENHRRGALQDYGRAEDRENEGGEGEKGGARTGETASGQAKTEAKTEAYCLCPMENPRPCDLHEDDCRILSSSVIHAPYLASTRPGSCLVCVPLRCKRLEPSASLRNTPALRTG
jgi:hypothetical protein